jgi:hypothetical protein
MKGKNMTTTIIDTLEPLQNLLEGPDWHGLHWQRACIAYWREVVAGLPEEKRDRPCPWTIQALVLALEHIDFMELHREGEVIYDWLVRTFPDMDGDTHFNNTAEVPHEPYPQDPHDA